MNTVMNQMTRRRDLLLDTQCVLLLVLLVDPTATCVHRGVS